MSKNSSVVWSTSDVIHQTCKNSSLYVELAKSSFWV